MWISFLMEYALLYELLCFHVNMIKKTHWAIGIFLCKLSTVNNFTDTLGKTIKFYLFGFSHIQSFCLLFVFPGLWKMEENQSHLSNGKYFEAPANSKTVISPSRKSSYVAIVKKKILWCINMTWWESNHLPS